MSEAEAAAVWVKPSSLKPWAGNPRRNAEAVEKVRDSIKRFGFGAPLLARRKNREVIAGHTRLLAAQAEGLERVPVRFLDLSEEEAHALSLADNRLGEIATWDIDALTAALGDLDGLLASVAGFSEADIKALLTTSLGEPGAGLAEQFVVPPFTVLDARAGYWQDRKRAWLSLGIQSELGRGENLLSMSDTALEPDPAKRAHVRGRARPWGAGAGGLKDAGARSASGAWARSLAAANPRDGRTALALATGPNASPQAVANARARRLRPNAHLDEKSQRALGVYQAFGSSTISRQGAHGAAAGTSIFDPVLCELVYRWFCPPGGMVLDPFAGGSVRGIVAARLGRRYLGIDLSRSQVEANREQLGRIGAPSPAAAAPSSSIPRVETNGPRLEIVEGPRNIFRDLAVELWDSTSGTPMRRSWPGRSAALGAYLSQVYKAVGDPLDAPDGPALALAKARDDGSIWCGFSGGKDSIAAALLARERGFRPVLYHLAGITRSTPDELRFSQEAAKALGMPLVVDRCRIRGPKTRFIEIPTRNQIIITLMVGRMLEAGACHWTMGTHGTAKDENCTADLNWSDSIGAMSLYAAHLAEQVEGLRFHQMMFGQIHSLAVCAKHGYLDFAHGCNSQLRFRGKLRATNERKFGKALLPGRCGSCNKCWAEYLMLCALGVVERQEDFHEHARSGLARIAATRQHEWKGDAEKFYLIPKVIEDFKGTAWKRKPPKPPAFTKPEFNQEPQPAPRLAPALPAKPPEVRWLVGDSREEIPRLPQAVKADLVFTCPPYHDLEIYSDDPRDLSRLSWPAFREAYREIIASACSRLAEDRFAVYTVGDVRDPEGFYRGLVAETIDAFRAAGLALYNEAILVTAIGSLSIRAGRVFAASRKLGKAHQNLLVFSKGDPLRAVAAIGEVQAGDVESFLAQHSLEELAAPNPKED